MKQIFLVEDDMDIRELMEFLLADQGYEVEAFATAEAFTNRIENCHPDLILLDVMLPDGNGVEICYKLKSESETSSIPVIIMSAHIDSSILKKSCGDDFLAKPFDISDFSGKVSRQLETASE